MNQQSQQVEVDNGTRTWTAPRTATTCSVFDGTGTPGPSNSPPSSNENEQGQDGNGQRQNQLSEKTATPISESRHFQTPEHPTDCDVDAEAAEVSTPAPMGPTYERYIALRSKLQEITQLRLKAQEKRSILNREGENIRTLQSQVVQDMRKLVESMREKLTNKWPDSLKEDDLTDWEDCLIEIVDSTDESEEASKKLDSERNTLNNLERDLRGLENELCNQNADPNERNNLQSTRNILQNNSAVHASVPDQQDIDRNNETDEGQQLPRSRIVGSYASDSSGPKAKEDSSADTLDGYEEPDLVSDGSQDAMLQMESGPSSQLVKVDLSPPQDELSLPQNEDTLGNGFQFIDASEAIVPEADELAGMASNGLENGFPGITEGDIDSFNHWLFHGTPWNSKWAENHERLSALLSNLQFVKRWLTRTLQTIYSGTFALPHLEPAESANSMSVMQGNVRTWMWDPATAFSGVLTDSVREKAKKHTEPQPLVEIERIVSRNPLPRFTTSVDQLRRSNRKQKTKSLAQINTQTGFPGFKSNKDHSSKFPVVTTDTRLDAVEADQLLGWPARPSSEKQFRLTSRQNASAQENHLRRSSSLEFGHQIS